MLLRLSIKDLAIIDSLTLDFAPGFSVLTGETGAGKSIIIGALNLILGERASSDDVRTGSESAQVEALLDISGCKKAKRFLNEANIIAEDNSNNGEIIIRREVTAQGRSRCLINGRMVTLGQLKQLGDLLVDLHGQHQHQSLLRIEVHREILDAFGNCHDALEAYRKIYRRHGEILNRIRSLNRDEREVERQKGILEFQLKEIRQAELEPGEDTALEEEHRRLQHADALERSVVQATDALYEGETQSPTVEDLLAQVENLLTASAQLDPSLSATTDRLAAARVELEDISDVLREYAQRLQHDPARLAEVEERLHLIRQLRRKYGATLDDVLAAADRFENELHSLTHSREEQERLEAERKTVETQLAQAAETLSAKRGSSAEKFSKGLRSQLVELEMPSVRIEVRLDREEEDRVEAEPEENEEPEPIVSSLFSTASRRDEVGKETALGEGRLILFPNGKRYRVHEFGVDLVEFLISPNPGEEVKPLRKIASGGELSRIMLALKALMSGQDEISTLVFDEIDTGISGVTGTRIGEKMARLGEGQQVICITHLAQIAARAEHHFAVRKTLEKKRTLTRVEILNAETRIDEIARLLGGDPQSEIARNHARELLETSGSFRKADTRPAAKASSRKE